MSAALADHAAAAARAAGSGATWLADATDVGDELHKAGPVAVVIVVLLSIGCFLLFRSMSKHLRHVREDFPVPPERPRPGAGSGVVAADGPTPPTATSSGVTSAGVTPTVGVRPGGRRPGSGSAPKRSR